MAGALSVLSRRGAAMPTIVAPGSTIGTRCGRGSPNSSTATELPVPGLPTLSDGLGAGTAGTGAGGWSSADLPGRTAGIQSLPLYLYQRSLSSPIIHQ